MRVNSATASDIRPAQQRREIEEVHETTGSKCCCLREIWGFGLETKGWVLGFWLEIRGFCLVSEVGVKAGRRLMVSNFCYQKNIRS